MNNKIFIEHIQKRIERMIMQKNYNILIIGNGFDLAHGLPTTYSDFLDFGEKVNRIFANDKEISVNEYTSKNLVNWHINDVIKTILKEVYENRTFESGLETKEQRVSTRNAYIDEIHELIANNIWYKYFLDCRSEIGENWIDFESEISKVIQALEYARAKADMEVSFNKLKENVQQRLIAITKNEKQGVQEICSSIQKIDHLASDLNKELIRLIRALEIYISEFVEKIEIYKTSPDITDMHVDRLLSFNYSNTFESIYGSGMGIEYDYIHGKADISNNIYTNNMVLGIDEYLDDERKDKDTAFISFKKFYQRIYKCSTMKAKEWSREIKQEEENTKFSRKFLREKQIEYEIVSQTYNWDAFEKQILARTKEFDEKHIKYKLFIFGHSLDVTDKDILRDLILNDNVETTIYYYSKTGQDKGDFGNKIANLTKVIGEEELVKRTSEHTIIFKKMRDLVDRQK